MLHIFAQKLAFCTKHQLSRRGKAYGKGSGGILGHGVARSRPHTTPGGIQGSEAGVGLPLKIAGRIKNALRPRSEASV